jgi:hypothetical protein
MSHPINTSELLDPHAMRMLTPAELFRAQGFGGPNVRIERGLAKYLRDRGNEVVRPVAFDIVGTLLEMGDR